MGAALYPQSVKKTRAVLSAANANRDGTGTLVTLLTGATGGSIAGTIQITPPGTVTEGWIAFFADDGTDKTYIGELVVPAWTPNLGRPPIVLKWTVPEAHRPLYATTNTIKAATKNAETFHVESSYTNYA